MIVCSMNRLRYVALRIIFLYFTAFPKLLSLLSIFLLGGRGTGGKEGWLITQNNSFIMSQEAHKDAKVRIEALRGYL